MKNKVILVGADGRPSMRGVYSLMKNKNVDLVIRRTPVNAAPFYRVYEDNNSEDAKRFKKAPIDSDFSDSLVIRWGTRNEVSPKVAYNNVQSLARATNKKESRVIMSQAGVVTPKNVTPENFTLTDLPIIARPLQHSKGRNFVVFKDYGSFKHHYENNNSGWYYSAFVNKTQEFRVHVAHGKILAVMSKPAPTRTDVIAWNRAINGEEFTAVKWGEANRNVCLEALKAVESLKLDFGGVDVMVMEDKAYVLEVNTAPTLNSSPYVTQKYAQYFDWLFAKEEKREHFNYKDFKKVVSYFWKPFNFEDREPNKAENEE